MRIPVLVVLSACEPASSLGGIQLTMPAVTLDPVQPHVTVRIVAAEPAPPPPPRPLPVPRLGELPRPPTDEPRAYQAWLENLDDDTVARLEAYCATHPVMYQRVCGGIGPLHIPIPPYVFSTMNGQIQERGPDDPKLYFSSVKTWRRSLSTEQFAEVIRMCRVGSDADRVADRNWSGTDLCGPVTPLVIAFDNEPIAYTTGGTFAFRPGTSDATDWPTAATPWLVFDRDGDGAINSGRELFGNNTQLSDARLATNGFVALAELDSDRNGRIDRDDAAFGRLQLWADRDANQRSSADELRPAGDVLVSISLAYRVDARCDARGNCEGERAEVRWRDGDGVVQTGSIVDIYLRAR